MWPVTGGIVQTDSNRRYCAARGWYVRAAVTKCLGAAAIAMLTGFCSLMSTVTERGRRVRDHAVSNGGGVGLSDHWARIGSVTGNESLKLK